MQLPDAVYDHSSSQRIFRAGDGLRQFEPAAAVSERRRLPVTQYRKKPPWDFRPQVLGLPSDFDFGIRWLLGVVNSMKKWISRRRSLFERSQIGPETLQMLLPRPRQEPLNLFRPVVI